MKTMTKTNTHWSVLAAIAAAAFFASSAPGRAEQKERPSQTCPTTKDVNGMHCVVAKITVTSDGILHCGYVCSPKAAAAAAGMAAIDGRSAEAYAGLNLKDPASVKKVNAALRKANADRAAYAKAHAIKLNSKDYTHKIGTGTVEKTTATQKK
jgi:hypothetical protein